MEKIKVLIADDHRVVESEDVGPRCRADGREHASYGRGRSDETNQARVPSHRSRGPDHV